MKFINKNKSVFLMLVAISMAATLHAQQTKADVSVGDQYKNNAVPGLRYADPAASKKTPKPKPTEGSSLAYQLKTGTVPGMKFAPGTGQVVTPAPAKKTTPVNTGVILPSEMTKEQIKAAADKQAAQQPAPVIIPTQEEKAATDKPVKEEKPATKEN